MSLLVAPSEPPELRALGTYSPLCEQHGSDYLYLTEQGEMCGVQRKAIEDLVSSLGERLNRELAKMTPLDVRVVLIEGLWMWTSTGDSLALGKYGARSFNRKSYNGLVLSLQHEGFWVVTTDHISHTAEWLTQAGAWLDRRQHTSLSTRPKPPRNMFGTRDSAEWRLHFWQTFEGIGIIQAKELDAHFNGRLPATWGMTRDEWMVLAKSPEKGGCRGIGKERAQKMWDALMSNRSAPFPPLEEAEAPK